MGRVLSMADIVAAVDSPQNIEYARIPGFKDDEEFVVASVTAGDMIEWSEANEGEAKRTAGLRLIVKSLVDGQPGVDEGATGKRIANDTHIAVFRKVNHKVSERVVKDILKLNGMSVKQDKTEKND